MKIEDQGTIVLFIPETDEEYAWLKENTQNEGVPVAGEEPGRGPQTSA